jgi:hypothetical protein
VIPPSFIPENSVLAYLPGLSPDELQNDLPDVWKRDLTAERRAAPDTHHASRARSIVE